ncbi:hypothetical protein E1258_19190 [Micromonospora sp. KC207]|nr:hypothetical protein E1258_19190 [Micromonospora sp. KC207]
MRDASRTACVLYQVPTARRTLFVNLVRGLPGHRIAVEAPAEQSAARRAVDLWMLIQQTTPRTVPRRA